MDDEKVLFYDYRSSRYFIGGLISTLTTLKKLAKRGNTYNDMYEDFGLPVLMSDMDNVINPDIKVLVTYCEENKKVVYIIC